MIVILSPSKTQDFENENRTDIYTQPAFIADTKQLLEEIQKMEIEELQKVMQISERIAFLNYNRFQDVQFPFDAKNDRQAIISFRGDVYEGLDADTLTDEELQFAQLHLRIISGFYGILRPLDLIQPYRLEMKTPLKTKRGNNLYEFWGKFLTDYFNTRFTDQTLINLASLEYANAIINKNFKLPVITPVFREEKEGKLKTIAIFAKKARGKMARYIITNQLKQPNELKSFKEDGYKFDEQLSSKTEWVFVRPQPEKLEQIIQKDATNKKKRGRKPKTIVSQEEE